MLAQGIKLGFRLHVLSPDMSRPGSLAKSRALCGELGGVRLWVRSMQNLNQSHASPSRVPR